MSKDKKKIMTFASLRASDDESNDSEEGQAFYAGGSEASGQQILGPSKKKETASNIIENLFKRAKDSGAQEANRDEDRDNKPVSTSGYRLGDGTAPTEFIPNRTLSKKAYVLRMWRNGFTIDEGPLKAYTEPANKKFLESIERGMIPDELVREANGAEIHVDMEDHRTEEFIPPKPAYVLYNAEGYKLGSPTPNVVTNVSPQDLKLNEEAAKRQLNTNDTEPVTNIQIRFSDGTKLIVKANHKHTVEDLRRYIVTYRPEYNSTPFAFHTHFPSKEIQNETDSLADAKLLNSVIIQKLN